MHRLPINALVALSLFLFFTQWQNAFSIVTGAELTVEEAFAQMSTVKPEAGDVANRPSPPPEQAPLVPNTNPQLLPDLPQSDVDLRQIQGWRDQGLITAEVYEQKLYDLQQIQTLLNQNLIGPDVYNEKRRIILGEAPQAHTLASPPSVNAHSRTADRLLELKGLLDQNLITPEEYKRKREAILDEL